MIFEQKKKTGNTPTGSKKVKSTIPLGNIVFLPFFMLHLSFGRLLPIGRLFDYDRYGGTHVASPRSGTSHRARAVPRRSWRAHLHKDRNCNLFTFLFTAAIRAEFSQFPRFQVIFIWNNYYWDMIPPCCLWGCFLLSIFYRGNCAAIFQAALQPGGLPSILFGRP